MYLYVYVRVFMYVYVYACVWQGHVCRSKYNSHQVKSDLNPDLRPKPKP
jgi:hypothetical protein